jgi:hypothetical protein
MPLVHQRHTRNNNPFHLLADDDDNDDIVVASNCSPHSLCPNLQPIDLPAVLKACQPVIQLARQPTSVRPSTPSNTPPPRVLLPPKIISITRNRVLFPAIIPGNRVPFPARRSDSDSQNGKQSSVSTNSTRRLTLEPKYLCNFLIQTRLPSLPRLPSPSSEAQPSAAIRFSTLVSPQVPLPLQEVHVL